MNHFLDPGMAWLLQKSRTEGAFPCQRRKKIIPAEPGPAMEPYLQGSEDDKRRREGKKVAQSFYLQTEGSPRGAEKKTSVKVAVACCKLRGKFFLRILFVPNLCWTPHRLWFLGLYFNTLHDPLFPPCCLYLAWFVFCTIIIRIELQKLDMNDKTALKFLYSGPENLPHAAVSLQYSAAESSL